MLLTLEQAASKLGKSLRQVRCLIKTGRLKATKMAGRWMIDDHELSLPPAQARAQGRKEDRLHQAVEEVLATSGSSRAAPFAAPAASRAPRLAGG